MMFDLANFTSKHIFIILNNKKNLKSKKWLIYLKITINYKIHDGSNLILLNFDN